MGTLGNFSSTRSGIVTSCASSTEFVPPSPSPSTAEDEEEDEEEEEEEEEEDDGSVSFPEEEVRILERLSSFSFFFCSL